MDPLEIQLIAGTLPPPACYASEQERFEAYVAAITATTTGGIQWVADDTAPASLDSYWLRLDSNGRPIEALKWSDADGIWLRWFDLMVFGTDTGAANAYAITNTPAFTAVTAYKVGKSYTFIAANANSGASTFNVDGMGAKTIKKNTNEDLAQGDIKAGQVVTVVYDGTYFQTVSRLSATSDHGSLFDQTPGTGKTWTCPANVTSIEVSLVGGGGGGNQDAGTAGGGGGGFCYKRWSVTPGTVYKYDIGSAGTKATSAGTDTSGGNSRFNTDAATPQVASGGTKASGGGAGGSYSGADWGIAGTAGDRAIGDGRFMGGQSAFPGSQAGWSFTNIVGGQDGILGGGGATDTDPTSKDSSSGGAGAMLLKW